MVAVLSLPLAWLAWTIQTVRIEMTIANKIQDLDGWAFFDEQVDGKEPSHLFPRLKGVAFYARSHVSDADLTVLQNIPCLEDLFIANVNVTDEGLSYLRSLLSLRSLQLSSIRITDAGIRNLYGLANLRWLQIEDTQVTPAGVAGLQKALPKCKIDYVNTAEEPRT
jgi:hypothetical protein